MSGFEIAVLVVIAAIGMGVAKCVDRLTEIRETLIAIRNRLPIPESRDYWDGPS